MSCPDLGSNVMREFQMKRTLILGAIACAVASGAMSSSAQAQSMFAECRPGYTYDLGKNMCMSDKKAKKASKKKASKKAKAKT